MIHFFKAHKQIKPQWQVTGHRAGSQQRWPHVSFLRVHRPKAPGLKLGLGSGSPPVKGAGEAATSGPGAGVYVEPHPCLRSQPAALAKGHSLDHEGLFLDWRTWAEGRGGQVKWNQEESQQMRKGKQREGRETKTPIQGEPTNDNSDTHKEHEHREN